MRISVIVPVYGVEAFLDDCMQSIFAQTHQEMEVLLVDDGSPDKCPAMCDGYAALDSRVRVIHKQNEGLGLARNTGLSAATGDYVCFVDSDDFLPPDALERLAGAACASGAEIVCGNYEWVYPDGKRAPRGSIPEGEIPRERLDDIAGRYPFFFSEAYLVMAWGKLYKRSFLEEHALLFDRNSEIYEEDRLFAYKAFIHKPRYVLVDRNVYCYRYNEQSIMNSYKKDYPKRMCAFFENYAAYLWDRNVYFDYLDLIGFHLVFAAYLCGINEMGTGKKPGQAFQQAVAAFAENKTVRQIATDVGGSGIVRQVPSFADRRFIAMAAAAISRGREKTAARLLRLAWKVKERGNRRAV